MPKQDVNDWLIVAYSLPAEPSRKRVLVWRHLRKLGAVYLETGIWVIPRTDETEPATRAIAAEVRELGGTALAFVAEDMDAAQHDSLRDSYNRVRREEYVDLLQKCDRFLAHVGRLSEADAFSFANLEELEEDLEKRRRSLAQIAARDVFVIDERREVEASLSRCEDALARFVEETSLREQSRPI